MKAARRIIGLTGGIATGKSTVTQYLAQRYHLPILDADHYAREVVKPNSEGLEAIVARYGTSLLLKDGSLNRSQLAEIIFNNPQAKEWLENLLHPLVYEAMSNDLALIKEPTVVLAIPLLFEANFTDLVTEIWVVYCEPKQQLARLISRDKLNSVQAWARINSQWSLDKKVALADVVLDNRGGLADLYQQIDQQMQV
ncbi:MAG: dephospho-CoA kinase [Cyanobacteria bacterium J083]|nr:MAG: dephospho-CoA kinase [Cyanobacteria bacterium J083]